MTIYDLTLLTLGVLLIGLVFIRFNLGRPRVLLLLLLSLAIFLAVSLVWVQPATADDDRISHHDSFGSFVSDSYYVYYICQCRPIGRQLSDNRLGAGAFLA